MTSISPYLPEMIESFGVPHTDVGRYVGLVTGLFALGQAPAVLYWGRLADSKGRKPAILWCMFLASTAMLIWGFSTTLAVAMAARFVLGIASGDVGIIRTMVAEVVTDKQLQPTAFAIMPMTWSLCSIFGPALGGMLAHPTKTMPRLFGNNALFTAYPFLLPNLLCASFYFFACVVSWLFLEETHLVTKHHRDRGLEVGQQLTSCGKAEKHKFRPLPMEDEAEAGLLDATPLSPTSPTDSGFARATEPEPIQTKMTRVTYREVLTRQAIYVMTVYFTAAFGHLALDALIAVFMHQAVRPENYLRKSFSLMFTGGFGIDATQIGTLLFITSVPYVFIQILLYPYLVRIWGLVRVMWLALVLMPLACFLMPFTVLLRHAWLQQGAMVVIWTMKQLSASIVFPSSYMLVFHVSGGVRSLSTLNGLSLMVSATGRAIGPAMAGFLYTTGLKLGSVVIPWWTLGIISIIGYVPMLWIEYDESPKVGGKTDKEDDSEALLPESEDDDGK